MFISHAFAQTAPAAASGSTESTLFSLLPLVLMFVVLYFIMIRPQMKRQKEHKAMIDALAKGDEVVIAGGVLGRVCQARRLLRPRRGGQRRRSAGAASGRDPGPAQGHASSKPLSSAAAARAKRVPWLAAICIGATMNRYPWWKYAILGLALLVGLLYAVPNLYGEAPAVQVSSGKATLKLDASMADTGLASCLPRPSSQPDFVQFEGNSVKARFSDTDAQKRAKDALSAALNPDPADPSYIVALNLLSRSPEWMARVRALPMYLGLDLRGGVHFLMQVDMKSALTKKAESLTGDIRTLLRDKNIRHAGITRDGNVVELRFRDRPRSRRRVPCCSINCPTCNGRTTADGADLQAARRTQARGGAPRCRIRR